MVRPLRRRIARNDSLMNLCFEGRYVRVFLRELVIFIWQAFDFLECEKRSKCGLRLQLVDYSMTYH